MALAAQDGELADAARLDIAADVVLLDIEGTISPTSFVRDVLFSYSRARLASFVESHRDDPPVAAILAEASDLAGGGDPVAALARWQDEDRKIGPLKKLQGLIWKDGYESGAFQSSLYPDALAALTRWYAAGVPLYIYSSGSVAAQRLFFAHSTAGDLRPLFAGHFDTDIGAKTEARSYALIADRIGTAADRIVFLSDNPAEVAAAEGAGLLAVHVVKDDTPAVPGFAAITDFAAVRIARA